MRMNIGTLSIMVDVELTADCTEECGSRWLTGDASVSVTCVNETRIIGSYDVAVGCWADSDDDHGMWQASHEGERIIAAVMGDGHDDSFERSRAVQRLGDLMPSECEELGLLVCEALRTAARK